MSEQAANEAAKEYFASKKTNEVSDFNEEDFLMWGSQLEVNAEACSIDDPTCEACGS